MVVNFNLSPFPDNVERSVTDVITLNTRTRVTDDTYNNVDNKECVRLDERRKTVDAKLQVKQY